MAQTLPRISGSTSQDFLISVINQIVDFINSNQRTTVTNDGATNRYLIGYQKDGWGPGKDFGIKVSKPGVNVLEAADEDLLYKDDFTTKSWFNDSGINYRKDGLLDDSSYGIEISQSDVNVDDANDQQIVMSSNFNNLKVVQSGEVTLTGGTSNAVSSSYTLTVPHNLGYKPVVIAYAEDIDGSLQNMPFPRRKNVGGSGPLYFMAVNEWVYCQSDINELVFYVEWYNPSHPSNYTVNNLNIKYYILAETASP